MSNRIYNVAIYLRLSKDDGDDLESQSITNQRKIIGDYISKQANIKMFDEYVDDGYSGANFNRPDFQRMLKDIDKKLIDIVITKDLSRFGRNYVECGQYIEKAFPDKGVRYIAILDGIDNFEESAINDFMPLKSVFNEKHCKNTSVGVKRSKRQRMTEGIYACNIPPFGYKKDPNADGKLIIDEEPAKTVRKIFDLKLNGYTNIKIAEYLQANNYITPGMYLKNVHNEGRKKIGIWKSSTVNRILCNKVYLGHCLRGKTQNISYKTRKRINVRRDDLIITYNTHEAIISEEVFSKVHNTKKYGSKMKQVENDFLLNDLIICECCKKKMFFKRVRERVKIYCGGNMQSSFICMNGRVVDYLWLEEKMKEEVRGMYEQYMKKTKYLDKLYKTYHQKQIESLERILDELKKKLSKINNSIANVYSKRLSNDKTEDYEEQYKNLVADRKRINEEIASTEQLYNNKKMILYNVEHKNEILRELDYVTRNELTNSDMKKLIKNIVVSEEKIVINYNFHSFAVEL